VLGRLFGATTDDDEKTEIVLAITPHLVRNLQRPDAANAVFNSGTETSLHAGQGGGGGNSPAPAVSSPSPTTSPAATMPTPPAGAGTSLNGTGTNYGSGLGDTGLSQTALTGTDASNGTGEVAAGGVPAAGIAQMQWQGNAVAAVGGTVTLSLVMQSTQAITSLPMTIGFDPARLEVVNIAEGPFLRSGGSGTSFTSRLGNGQLTLSDVASSGAGATAEGVFATVTFRALAAATSTSVQLLSAAPTGIGNVSISLAPPAPFSLQITQ
ncbi:MAG TPA: cohesin domain-containing protein, partial [Magnetospirillaceae bacterium]|nr:cohesin domain-containing protein [Magnetospirillaceae bacterium]